MKKNKPVYLIFVQSTIIFLLSLLSIIALNYQIIKIPLWVLIVFPFLIGIISFLFFYFFIEKIIDSKIEDFNPTNPVIVQKRKNEPNTLSEEQQLEISKLKEQEVFRREFLGNLAHELKTPVFSIQGYILTLLDGALEDKTVNRLFLERASNSIDRMVNLLEDLDNITKMEANELKLDLENFDIKKLVEEVYDSLELKAKEKNIRLKFSKDYQNIIVNADKTKITQVLTNLIANSIYYGNENGTTSTRFFQMNNLILIEISDDGPGIDEVDLPRIFERFYRVEKSRTRNEGGSGLGLAIAKHVIERHKHVLTVRSSIGLGSTFTFSLDKSKSNQEYFLTSRGVRLR